MSHIIFLEMCRSTNNLGDIVDIIYKLENTFDLEITGGIGWIKKGRVKPLSLFNLSTTSPPNIIICYRKLRSWGSR